MEMKDKNTGRDQDFSLDKMEIVMENEKENINNEIN